MFDLFQHANINCLPNDGLVWSDLFFFPLGWRKKGLVTLPYIFCTVESMDIVGCGLLTTD